MNKKKDREVGRGALKKMCESWMINKPEALATPLGDESPIDSPYQGSEVGKTNIMAQKELVRDGDEQQRNVSEVLLLQDALESGESAAYISRATKRARKSVSRGAKLTRRGAKGAVNGARGTFKMVNKLRKRITRLESDLRKVTMQAASEAKKAASALSKVANLKSLLHEAQQAVAAAKAAAKTASQKIKSGAANAVSAVKTAALGAIKKAIGAAMNIVLKMIGSAEAQRLGESTTEQVVQQTMVKKALKVVELMSEDVVAAFQLKSKKPVRSVWPHFCR